MPKVSVICLVYDAAPFIERCARSLFEQTLDDLEFIFVDDCTPDNSFEILQRVLAEYPRRRSQVRIIKMAQNSRQAAARTAGMKAATGNYMIHCDSDDWVERDAYELMYDKAVESGADVVGCKAVVHINGKTSTAETFYEGLPSNSLYEQRFGGSLWAKLISTKLIHDTGIYPYEGINNGEDLNVTVRVFLKARKMAFVDRRLYHYNHDNQNSITRRNSIEQLHRYVIPNIERIAQEFEAVDDSRKNDFIDTLKFNAKFSFLDVPGLTFKDLQFLRNLWAFSNKILPRHRGLTKTKRKILSLAIKSDLAFWVYYKLKSLKKSLKPG